MFKVSAVVKIISSLHPNYIGALAVVTRKSMTFPNRYFVRLLDSRKEIRIHVKDMQVVSSSWNKPGKELL